VKKSRYRSRRYAISLGMLLAQVCVLEGGDAQAAQTLRVQVDQNGDFLLIGNTLAYDCAAGTPMPIVGNVGACGTNTNDTAPDIFWQSDTPMAGQAQANNTVTMSSAARSTAVLTVPPGAIVTHAFLYWGANLPNGAVDDTVTLDRPGAFSQNLMAIAAYTSANNAYQGVADITSIVEAQGSGAYRVTGVDGATLVNANNDTSYAGWWMVVFYELPSDPPRNLALFDGLDNVGVGNPQNLTLTGFQVPPVFTAAKLGIVTFEGDATITGDSFSFGPAPALTDAVNPADNFFNGTRSNLGMPVSNVGDLPQLSGAARSMSGMDIDVVDVTSKLMPGQMSVPIAATSTQDVYFLAGFVTSIPTFKPDFSTSQKAAVDVNGGTLLPGEVVEYTIVATNTGNDTSINTVLTDPLPIGVTYVPDTISITAGANMGAKTDMTADDQCEYDPGTRTVFCRLGMGANAMIGGQIAVGESSTVKFSVTIDATASGTIFNQATVMAGGLLGAPAEGTPTDGNGAANGQPPTAIEVTPCVQTGAEVCDNVDNDCNGLVDDNCGACGNGTLENGEGCDDGNLNDGDGCDSVCRGELGTACSINNHCTSGFCDSANNTCACDHNVDCPGVQVCNVTSNPNACVNPGCGNAVLEAMEGCEDGNTTNGDGCSSVCLREIGIACSINTQCVSGFCDPAGDICACDADFDCPAEHICAGYACIPVGCGDGLLASNETCDDGNTLDGDGCDSNCTPTSCGNGIQTAGEGCDDGNLLDDDGCSASCETEMTSGTGGTGNGTTNQPPGCACSVPANPSSTGLLWLTLPLLLSVRRSRRRSYKT
jgi:uncharacterized repeat protein (TIGR01451 family)/MYXO-CTERM domain-containing protein